MVARLHLPHAIEVRLHAHQIDVVILTPQTVGTVGALDGSPSLSVGFPIQGEAMDAARSASQGAHYHADVSYLLP